MDRAFIEKSRGDFDAAVDWMTRSRDGFLELEDTVRAVRKSMDLSQILSKQNKDDEARKLLYESIELLEKLKITGPEDNLAFGYSCLAKIEARGGNADKAADYYQRSMQMYKQLGSEKKVTEIKTHLETIRLMQETESVYNRIWQDGQTAFFSEQGVKIDSCVQNLEADKRRGLSFIARPSEECVARFATYRRGL